MAAGGGLLLALLQGVLVEACPASCHTDIAIRASFAISFTSKRQNTSVCFWILQQLCRTFDQLSCCVVLAEWGAGFEKLVLDAIWRR